jgi:hypothetical protein
LSLNQAKEHRGGTLGAADIGADRKKPWRLSRLP